jgi:hypothetical protein
VKSLTVFLISACLAIGQAPGTIVTFNRADTEHCKVITLSGRPLLQSTYGGISVAIAMPLNRGNGDFSIFVAVSQANTGTVQVNPKEFYGLYSDKDHTRFTFFDKAAELESKARAQGANAGMSAANSQVDPGSIRPGAVGPGGPPPGGGPPDSGNGGPPMEGSPSPSALYFRKGKVKAGSGIAGWITLRQPRDGKLEVHPTDMLDEVDIPVNGFIFRF